MRKAKESNGRGQRPSRDKTDCRMVWLKVGFHTDFDDGDEQLRLTAPPVRVGKYWRAPKNCWDSGFVRVLTNEFQGLEKNEPIPFNSLEELVPKLIGILQRQGMTVHRRTSKVRNLAEVMTRFHENS